jgi:hypothetical protein
LPRYSIEKFFNQFANTPAMQFAGNPSGNIRFHLAELFGCCALGPRAWHLRPMADQQNGPTDGDHP